MVPPAWRATQGRLTDATGALIASLEESFLFVAPYSEPVDGWFSKAEIQAHCRTHRGMPEAFCLEHRNAYNYQLVDWGITLPYNRLQQLDEQQRYRVQIEVETKPGALQVAQWYLPGRRTETITLCSQFDELCNDGHSSAIIGALMMEQLAQMPEREFSYQLLLVPEMFGTLFYAYHERAQLDKTVAMLNLETLGAGKEWLLKRAFKQGGALEDALRLALQSLGIPFREGSFFEGYGNDERVFAWPTIDIPGPGLQRHPFEAYHTDQDRPEILEPGLLAEALAIIEKTLAIFEANFVPRYRNFLQPWLTKHQLYTENWNDLANHPGLNNELLYQIDGRNSLINIVKSTGIPFDTAERFLRLAIEAGVVEVGACEQAQLRY